ncbi:uncharacterized protein [Macrobrachium rosenbergii]|uniref:uncharacterized protein isoform X2 n=1 Tax=Macrobrachium rosenbergii TaxID=79674 RepID=UPI0034D71AD3
MDPSFLSSGAAASSSSSSSSSSFPSKRWADYKWVDVAVQEMVSQALTVVLLVVVFVAVCNLSRKFSHQNELSTSNSSYSYQHHSRQDYPPRLTSPQMTATQSEQQLSW